MACVGAGVRYEVKAQEPVLVQPLSEENHAPCFLSMIDQSVAPFVVDIVFVFDAKNTAATRHGVDGDIDPAKVMKEALRKVLVHFYPVAGRLGLSPDHNLFIECHAQGVSFVEADADIEISELGDLSQLHDVAATLHPLIFPLPSTADDRPLLTTQVTRFKCGGFVLGIVFQHCLFDGFAVGEFVNTWAATARGEPLSTPPVLDRSILSPRSPLQIKYPHMEYREIKDLCSTDDESNMIMRSFCFSRANLEILRKKAMEDGVVSKCTTFEALSGLMWRSRTRAIWSCSKQQPEQKVKLIIAVDGRRRMEEGAVPDGYVGNVVLAAGAEASVEELEEKPLSYAVKHVQDAIGRMTDEYMRSQIDFMECNKMALAGTNQSTSPRVTFGITSWSNLSFYTPDFGWGTPKHVGPVSLITNFTTIFIPYGLDNKGIHAVLALPPMVMQKFEELLHPYLLSL